MTSRIDAGVFTGGESSGVAYETIYRQRLAFFEFLATSHIAPVLVTRPRRCWVPLIVYLGHKVEDTMEHGYEDGVAWDVWYCMATTANERRRVVEVACTVRPELVDALHRADTDWPCPYVEHSEAVRFPITTMAGFHRHEIGTYTTDLMTEAAARSPAEVPRRCIILPCSAAKPYPSTLHQRVQALVPEDWELIVASSALGLCPKALWAKAPQYDAGIPYFGRVVRTVEWWFGTVPYEHVVCYLDFLAPWVKIGLDLAWRHASANMQVHWPIGHDERISMENLLHAPHLGRLQAIIGRIDRGEFNPVNP